jgi:hypothetical protein
MAFTYQFDGQLMSYGLLHATLGASRRCPPRDLRSEGHLALLFTRYGPRGVVATFDTGVVIESVIALLD